MCSDIFFLWLWIKWETIRKTVSKPNSKHTCFLYKKSKPKKKRDSDQNCYCRSTAVLTWSFMMTRISPPCWSTWTSDRYAHQHTQFPSGFCLLNMDSSGVPDPLRWFTNFPLIYPQVSCNFFTAVQLSTSSLCCCSFSSKQEQITMFGPHLLCRPFYLVLPA